MYVTGVLFLVFGGAGTAVSMWRHADKKASVFLLVAVLGIVMIAFASLGLMVSE